MTDAVIERRAITDEEFAKRWDELVEYDQHMVKQQQTNTVLGVGALYGATFLLYYYNHSGSEWFAIAALTFIVLLCTTIGVSISLCAKWTQRSPKKTTLNMSLDEGVKRLKQLHKFGLYEGVSVMKLYNKL